MSLRKLVKQLPGARAIYIALMRAKRRVRRMIFGPTKFERYDLETEEVLRRVLKRESNCIDLGANNGEILKLILQNAPTGKHHAVEALPHLAERLKELYPGVAVHSCAVSDHTDETVFHFVEDDPAYSGLKRQNYPRADFEVRQITVPVRRLDDLIPTDATIQLIKADVEGGEYQAFQGGRQTLTRCMPFVIFEFGPSAELHYGVTAPMMYSLLHDEIGLDISTMQRWLNDQPPHTAAEFADSFVNQIDLYFLAYPART